MKLQNQLHEILIDLTLVTTETSLMIGAVVLLILGLITKRSVLLKAVYAVTIVLGIYFSLKIDSVGFYLSDSLFSSGEIISFSSLFLLVGLLVLVFPRENHVTEFYFFILALLIGSIFMMKANSLLLIYLSIELVSFVSYILTGFSFRKEGFEAGIKYLLFGALSSAIMLVGLGFVYGSTGDLYVSSWSSEVFSSLMPQVGLLFILFGIFFKISIFPFHIWTPATYQTAPIDGVTIFSIVPKLSGLILLRRVLMSSGLNYDHWLVSIVLVLGISSIVVGTLGALRQSNARRMISFGSIAHSGFLMAFVVIPDLYYNKEAFWWYAVIYGIMNLGAFYVLDGYERRSILNVQDYSNTKGETWMGSVFTLILVSLVGLPPLAGFTAKLFLFSTLWEVYSSMNSILSIIYLLVAVFATVASLFFYLKIPKTIFLEKSQKTELVIEFSWRWKIIATIFAIVLLMLFFAPKMVMSLQLLLNNAYE